MSENCSFRIDEHGALDLRTSQLETVDNSRNFGDITGTSEPRSNFSSTSSNLSRSLNITDRSSSRVLNRSKLLGKRDPINLNEGSCEISKNSLLALETLNNSLDPFKYNISRNSGTVNNNSYLVKNSSISLNRFSTHRTVNYEDFKRIVDKICCTSSVVNDGASTSGISGSNSSVNKLIESDKHIYQHNQLLNSIRDEVNSNYFNRVKQGETSLAKLPTIPNSSGSTKSGDVWFPANKIQQGFKSCISFFFLTTFKKSFFKKSVLLNFDGKVSYSFQFFFRTR